MFKQDLVKWLSAIAFLCLTIFFGYKVEQKAFSFVLYFAWFASYIYILFQTKENSAVHFFLFFAVLARIALIPVFPLLSDDIYRFIWDGRLLINGVNPFDHLPTHWLTEAPVSFGLNTALFDQLNSPEYFTIYPPVCQSIFAISQWIAGDSLLGAAIVMKIFLVGSEIGSIYLLYRILTHLKIRQYAILIYALNPLIIIEISGNLHFEGAMIFFFLMAIWLLIKNKWTWSAIFLALSIASKLLPLMFLPFILSYYGWKKGMKYCLMVGGFCVLFFAPLLSTTFIQNFSTSLDLYFQKFEFNASIYYFFRWIGQLIIGYNLIKYIGPILALVTVLIIGILAIRKKITGINDFLIASLFAFTAYLFLGTTIHPWYLSIPILLSVFTNFKFPILWSLLIMLTYISYGSDPFVENLWIVGVEYILVFAFFIYEIRLYKLTTANIPAPAD